MSSRWIKIATVSPRFVCIGNSGMPGYHVFYAGRHYIFREIRKTHWPEIIADAHQTLRLHRLRSVTLACAIVRKRGEIQLLAEVQREKNNQDEALRETRRQSAESFGDA